MTPSDRERLDRITEVADRGMRYYTTAFLRRTDADERLIPDTELLRGCFMQLANFIALLEQEELDDRSLLAARHEVVDRYLLLARTDPWTPPPSASRADSVDGAEDPSTE
jgi:hypothetical protein